MADTPRMSGAQIITSRVELGEDLSEVGVIMAVKSDDEVYEATDISGERCVGIATGIGDEGEYIIVASSVYRFDNSENNAIAAANIGEVAYLEDSNTVRLSGSTASLIVGVIRGIDDNGVWVDMNCPTEVAISAS